MTSSPLRTRRPLRPATGGATAVVSAVVSAVVFAVASTAVACAPGGSDTVLRVALWAGGHELEIERQVADRYEALHPGVRVVLESAPNGYEERLLTSIAAGRPPDVYLMDSPDIPTFVERGLALDLAPYQEALGFRPDSVFGQVAEAFRRGQSMFALPKDFTPMVLYANRNVLAAAGVENLLPAALSPAAPPAAPPPVTAPSVAAPSAGWTWADFRRAAEAVVADTDGDGRPDVFGFDFPRNLYQWVPFVWSAGGDILAPGGSRAAGYLDGPEALEAYRFLTALAEDGLTPGAQFVQQGDPAREARFASGGQAFLLSGHWTLPVFRDLVEAGALDLAIVPIPHHPSRTAATSVLYASGWAVPPNASNLRRAIDLAGFLASPEAQRIRARSGLAIPSRIDVAAEIAAADRTGVEDAFIALVGGARMTWGARVRDFSRVEALAVEIMDRRLVRGEPLASSASDVARRIDAEFEW
ncbi:ABC transporter substrate-binding protein [Candidatus Palauibacter sp.]|uniref:ABC transporter substrate-binding protein n=1 Tax=Candidatus Palauibacter sp. TaxID=3101350 RepID=UPI003D0A5F93